MNIQDYPKRDQNYHAACQLARQEIKDGHALTMLTGYTPQTGRYIELQTDQGWNPEPFWCEAGPIYSYSD